MISLHTFLSIFFYPLRFGILLVILIISFLQLCIPSCFSGSSSSFTNSPVRLFLQVIHLINLYTYTSILILSFPIKKKTHSNAQKLHSLPFYCCPRFATVSKYWCEKFSHQVQCPLKKLLLSNYRVSFVSFSQSCILPSLFIITTRYLYYLFQINSLRLRSQFLFFAYNTLLSYSIFAILHLVSVCYVEVHIFISYLIIAFI